MNSHENYSNHLEQQVDGLLFWLGTSISFRDPMVHLQKKGWGDGVVAVVVGCCKSRTTATNQNCTLAKKFTPPLTFQAGSSFALPAGVWQDNKRHQADSNTGPISLCDQLWHGTAEQSTAQHSIAQYCTAKQRAAQHRAVGHT